MALRCPHCYPSRVSVICGAQQRAPVRLNTANAAGVTYMTAFSDWKLRYMKTMLEEEKWKEVERMKRTYKKENERDRRIRRRKRRNLPWSRKSFTFITNLIHLLPQGGTQMQLNLSENLMRQFPPSLGWRVCMVDGFRFPINPTRSRPDSLLLRRLRLIGWRHWSGFYFFLNEFFLWSI